MKKKKKNWWFNGIFCVCTFLPWRWLEGTTQFHATSCNTAKMITKFLKKNVQKCPRRAWGFKEHPPHHLQSWTKSGLGGFDKYAGKLFGFFLVTAIWGGCFIASGVPNRAALEWCQTARRAFAQTVTRLPLTTTDGVSHACCAGRLCYFSADA